MQTRPCSAARTANAASAAAAGDFPTGISRAGFVLKFAACVPEEYPNCLLGKLLAR